MSSFRLLLFVLFLSSFSYGQQFLAPLSLDLSSLPFGRTNSNNSWFAPQLFYSDIALYNQYIRFIRPNVHTPAWFTWKTLTDTNIADYGGGPFMATGMDFGPCGGTFLSLAYNNINGWDQLNAGFEGPMIGKIGIDCVPQAEAALSISDGASNWSSRAMLATGAVPPDWSIITFSTKHGININGHFSGEALQIQRDNNDLRRALTFHQGNGVWDTRIMMDENYDIVFYNANGTNCSAASPGKEFMRYSCASNMIFFSVPVVAPNIH